jgi:hypothetical protein
MVSQVERQKSHGRKFGLHIHTHDFLLVVFKEVALPYNNVVQSVGDAPQSAGYHAQDGTFANERGISEPYCAAFDMSLKHPHHYTGEQVGRILLRMLAKGIVPFWRQPSQGFSGPHIHAIDCHLRMKDQLQRQVREFLDGGDGLVGDNVDSFWFTYYQQKSFKVMCAAIRDDMRKSNEWRI